MNQADFFKILSKITGQGKIIPIPIELIKALEGDYHTAAMLTQLIYWSDKTKNEWIYKSYKEWKEEIALSEHKVREAKKKLEELGIIETKLKKANGSPTLHYRVNTEKLLYWLFEKLSKSDSNLENSQNGIWKISRMESEKFQETLTDPTTDPTTNINKSAENSATVKKEKITPSKNKNQTKNSREVMADFGQESLKTTQPFSEQKKKKEKEEEADEKVKKLKIILAKIYAKKYTQTTGLNYTEFGKLMKLTEKAAKWFFEQYNVGKIKDPENLIFRATLLINFTFKRGKTDPVLIFGKTPEMYAELKSYSEGQPFYKKYVEEAFKEAEKVIEEIQQLKEYKELLDLFK